MQLTSAKDDRKKHLEERTQTFFKERLADFGRRSVHPLVIVDADTSRSVWPWLKDEEIDRLQPIAITSKTMRPVVRSIAERIGDAKPPGWRTLARDYRKWLGAGRDIRAVISQ